MAQKRRELFDNRLHLRATLLALGKKVSQAMPIRTASADGAKIIGSSSAEAAE